jgi:hypothetical protein
VLVLGFLADRLVPDDVVDEGLRRQGGKEFGADLGVAGKFQEQGANGVRGRFWLSKEDLGHVWFVT